MAGTNSAVDEHIKPSVKESLDPNVASQEKKRLKGGHAVNQLYDSCQLPPCLNRSIICSPAMLIRGLLMRRGYRSEPIHNTFSAPSTECQDSYTLELVQAVRSEDLDKIKSLHAAGMSMSASNRFGESILHLACRHRSLATALCLLELGANPATHDDYGRTPLHDAFWHSEPAFDLVLLLLDRASELILHADVRGALPLDYARCHHWPQWLTFFAVHANRFWPRQTCRKEGK